MFLSDYTIFKKITSQTKNNSTTSTYDKKNEDNDLEIERLYNSSPIIQESSTTYEIQDHYVLEVESNSNKDRGGGGPGQRGG